MLLQMWGSRGQMSSETSHTFSRARLAGAVSPGHVCYFNDTHTLVLLRLASCVLMRSYAGLELFSLFFPFLLLYSASRISLLTPVRSCEHHVSKKSTFFFIYLRCQLHQLDEVNCFSYVQNASPQNICLDVIEWAQL